MVAARSLEGDYFRRHLCGFSSWFSGRWELCADGEGEGEGEFVDRVCEGRLCCLGRFLVGQCTR